MYNQFNIIETLQNIYNKVCFFDPLEQYFAYFGISTIAIMGLQLHEKKVDKHDILR